MKAKAKSKLEVLWQGFEKSGSIEAFLNYHQSKVAPSKKAKKESRPKSKR
jgi:hypothetical protein